MTLSVLEDHSPIWSLFKWDFSYNSCTPVDRPKTSTIVARRAVPLQ